MAFEQITDRLHRRLGESIFLTAQKAFLAADQRASYPVLLCQFFALLVLLLPVCVAALAIFIVIWSYPAWIGMAIGALFLCLAYALLPRFPQNTQQTFTANEMPELFRLLTAISDGLDTKAPDGVHLIADANAYAAEYGLRNPTRVLGVGMPLWAALDDQEKVALIAHEMAHFVNNDPARGKLLHLALQTVSAWDYFLAPDPFDMGRSLAEMISDLLQNLLRAPVLALGYLMTMLHFRESQHAEYLADASAARISGSDALVGVLRKTMLGALMDSAILSLYPYSKDQNSRIFDVMGAAVRSTDDEKATALLSDMEQQKLRADASHPPSAYRIAFVELLDGANPMVLARDFDFDAISQEMQAEADRLGERLMQSLEVQ